jgi:folate-binding protein YgfZ
MSEAAILNPETVSAAPTPLALQLRAAHPALALRMHAGALTPQTFSSNASSSAKAEIAAAASSAAVFDLGYRARIRVTGEDRLRWLNGMVSNAIQSLTEGHGNYNFILNAQGRIQGDAFVYRRADDLLLDTDRFQAPRLLAHLDHFIIMDDVELHPLDDSATGIGQTAIGQTSIGLAGPQAASLLDSLRLDSLGPQAASLAMLQFAETALACVPVTLVRAYSVLFPRFEIWFAPDHAAAIWKALTSAGATPIGIDAVEALRVLDGTPAYSIDFTDRNLPQETSQTRALNFNKGCYLGQEIVERIRSRATVHRNLRQFALDGATPAPPSDIREGDAAVGQLTSVAEIDLPGFRGAVALGFVRADAVARGAAITYDGGAAAVLEHPPTPACP